MASAWEKLLGLIREFCAGIDEAHGILHGVSAPEWDRQDPEAEAVPRQEALPPVCAPPPVHEGGVADGAHPQPEDLDDAPHAPLRPTAPPHPLWPRRAYRGMCHRRVIRF